MHFTIPKKILILDTYRNANVMLIVSKCWLVLVLTLPRDCVTGRSTAAPQQCQMHITSPMTATSSPLLTPAPAC